MRVLLLGAGGPAANSFARSLRLGGDYHIIGANSSEDDLLLAEADETHLIPKSENKPLSDYHLFSLIRKTRPDFAHSQPDEGVAQLSLLRKQIHEYECATFLPPHNHIKTCQDKYLSFLTWRNAGLPVPTTSTGWTEFTWPDTPLLHIRPRRGAGGKDSLRNATKSLAIQWLLNKPDPRSFTVAEFLPGGTVTWQGIYKDGAVVCSQLRRRLAWTDGERGSARISQAFTDPSLDALAEQAVAALGGVPQGIYGVDFTMDRYDLPRITEINTGRFFTTIEFFARCGVNMPDLYVRGCPKDHPAYGAHGRLDGEKWVRCMDREPVLA